MPCVDCAADIETHDGALVCDDCAPINYHRCPGCGQWYPYHTTCPDCVACDRCHDTVPEDQAIETVRGSRICPACRRDRYWQCPECDGWNRVGNDCANDCDDDDDDDDGDMDVGELVHPYSFKPYPVFHGTGPLFLGPEIEIEAPYGEVRECAELALSCLGDLGYLKEDGSIGHGFEIVTHPMSFGWAMAHFPWQMLDDLHDAGCEATDNTGIHVHVSRAGFSSPCHTFRWMKFIYRNEEQVTTVARRRNDVWAAFTDGDRKAVKSYAKGARGDRYRAINTRNTDTFELRIFASSLDPQEVQAALAFTAASVEYTRDLTVATITNGGWTWPAFVAWLNDRPAYAPLSEQLEALACVC